MAQFINNNEFEILTPFGFRPFAGIQQKQVNTHLILFFNDGTEIGCTPEHILLSSTGFKKTEDCLIGESICGKIISAITVVNEPTLVYDPIEVSEYQCYFSNDVVSHNCSFFGSVSNTLIASSKLKNLVFQQPTYSQECLDVYEKPQPKHTYVACVDVARGDANDFSVMSIIDVTQLPFKFVAKYRSNKIPPLIFPNVIAEIGQKYNNAWLLIETNDAGSQVADALKYELEYENLIYTVKNTRLSTQEMSFSQGKIGVMTTKKTKNIGCVNLKTLIENDQLIVTDFDTISEMTTFVSKLGSFVGDSGTNDDLVMTLVLFGWLSNQKNFKDLTNSNIRESLVANQQEVFKDIPFVIVDDHQSNLNQMEVLEPGDLYIVSESAWLFPQDKER